MVASLEPTTFTEREYLALEEVAQTKHEFVRGLILARAGAELAHNQVASNIAFELSRALGDRPCRVLGSNQLGENRGLERGDHGVEPASKRRDNQLRGLLGAGLKRSLTTSYQRRDTRMARTTLSTKGQIVLPQAIRTRLGLTAGSELEVTTEGDSVILRRVSRFAPVALEQAIGSVAYQGPVRSIEEMNSGIAEMLRARANKR